MSRAPRGRGSVFEDMQAATERAFEGAARIELELLNPWMASGKAIFPDGLVLHLGHLTSVTDVEDRAPYWRTIVMDVRTGRLPMFNA